MTSPRAGSIGNERIVPAQGVSFDHTGQLCSFLRPGV